MPPAVADVRTLRGAPRRKITLTWVPWTHERLASATGYGAGVASPGWYHHLWITPDRPIVRWLAKVAQALRVRDLPVSSAHVIEAVRQLRGEALVRQQALLRGDDIDAAVARTFLAAMQPAQLDVSLAALEEIEAHARQIDRQWQLRLERARYEATLAERRFDEAHAIAHKYMVDAAEMTDVEAEGRITLGCAGMYRPDHVDAWRRVTDMVHRWTPAKVCLQLGHSGRKGSTQLGWERMDHPLESGALRLPTSSRINEAQWRPRALPGVGIFTRRALCWALNRSRTED